MSDCESITSAKLLELLETEQKVFDLVRLVLPEQTEVITVENHQLKVSEKDPCFSVWDKSTRCKNCISLISCLSGKRMTKFEFHGDDVYYVISKPYQITDMDDQIVSMEMVNFASKDMFMETTDDELGSNVIRTINRELYHDSLTGVYNRRFYDENLFLSRMNMVLPKQLAFYLIDVTRFKHFNDEYGHECGDEVLIAVAQVLQNSITGSDFVMRIGGDEFVVILKNCEEAYAVEKITQMKQAALAIQLPFLKDDSIHIDVGLAYSNPYEMTKDSIKTLYWQADQKMYEDKHTHSIPETR